MAIDVEYIKHGQFTFDDEKIEEIAKTLEVANKREAFLGQFTSPTAQINGDQIIKRRQILVDPDAVADLNEGDTPRQDHIKLVTFSESTRCYGSYIPFGRHAVKLNRDSIVDMARRQLAHNRLFDVEMTRFIAFNSTTSTAEASHDTSNIKWWETLINLGIRLDKNNTKGDHIFLCPPEVVADIAREAKAANSLIQGTADGEKLVKMGYIGDYAGFHIVKCKEPFMYKVVDGNRNLLCFAFGKTEGGLWPIVDTGMGVNPQGQVIVKDLGSSGVVDPTNEVGSIASRIDYIGAYCEHPENIIRLTGVVHGSYGISVIDGDLPRAYKIGANADTRVGAGRANAAYQEVIVGPSFDMTFKAQYDNSGTMTELSNVGVTLKIGSSDGTTVSGTDPVRTVEPGVVYYYSVTVSGYKKSNAADSNAPATGTFMADPDKPELMVTLVPNS